VSAEEQLAGQKVAQDLLDASSDKNLSKFLAPSVLRQLNPEFLPFMSRPARRQIAQSLASSIAYRQGDEEYNIWYDKFLTDTKQEIPEKEAAKTRSDPYGDSGFTKSDFLQNFSTYFCVHFAKGCCCEG